MFCDVRRILWFLHGWTKGGFGKVTGMYRQELNLHLVRRSRMSGAVFVCSSVRRGAFVQGRAVAGIWSRRPCLGNGVVRVEIMWTYRHRGWVFSWRWTFDWCCVLIRDFVVGPFKASVRTVSVCFPFSNKNYVHGNSTSTYNSYLICI